MFSRCFQAHPNPNVGRLSLRPNAFPKQLEKLPDPRPGTASAATAAPSAPLAESEAEAEWLGTWAVNSACWRFAKTTRGFTQGIMVDLRI